MAVETRGNVAVASATFTGGIVCNNAVGGRACDRWPFVAGAAGEVAVETRCWCTRCTTANASSAVSSGAVGLQTERACTAAGGTFFAAMILSSEAEETDLRVARLCTTDARKRVDGCSVSLGAG